MSGLGRRVFAERNRHTASAKRDTSRSDGSSRYSRYGSEAERTESREEYERACAAFFPFVSGFKLSLNPEDVDEILYAVLTYSKSNLTRDEIATAVRQIDAHLGGQRRMYEAVAARIPSTPWVVRRQDDNGNRST